MKQIPKIKYENGTGRLYVDGKPFIAVGGELHNSSASSTEYMRENVWPALRPLNPNSVVATVSWEQIEPVEGEFDFAVVDDLIADAEKEGVRLTLIWFGLWKNSESSYVPRWVKKNTEKYRNIVHAQQTRATLRFHDGNNIISPLCQAAVEADANAYRTLMRHIHEVDKNYTVIIMQVENEIGVLGSARDFHPDATALFEKEIPATVAEKFGVSGDWKTAFGDDAEEYFMAWSYGNAVEFIAKAGKAEHNIPMYVNAWLQQYPDRAGVYPSGGPIAKVMDMWKLAAPSLSMFAPDLYAPNFEKVAKEYCKNENPLFIPEIRTSVTSAAVVFCAIGEYNCIGFHPFGIEDIFGKKDERLDMSQLMALNIQADAFRNEGSNVYLPASYKLIRNMMDILTKYQGTGKMRGFYKFGPDNGCILQFSKYDIQITYGPDVQGKPPAGGLVIEVDEDNFIFAGTNYSAIAFPKKNEELHVDFIMVEEGEFIDSQWKRRRILNGDEQRINIPTTPTARKVEFYKF